jgi:hypothetical protein
MWNLCNHNSNENALIIKSKLEGLMKVIPEARSINVSKNIDNTKYTSCDLVLECIFDTFTELEIYQNHPQHLEIIKFIKSVTNSRYCVEYEF